MILVFLLVLVVIAETEPYDRDEVDISLPGIHGSKEAFSIREYEDDEEPQPFEITLSTTECEYKEAEMIPCVSCCGGVFIAEEPVKVVQVGLRSDHQWSVYVDEPSRENGLNLMYSLVMSELEGITFVTHEKREYDIEDVYWRMDNREIRNCDVYKIIVHYNKDGRIPLLIDRFDRLVRKWGDLLDGRICERVTRVFVDIDCGNHHLGYYQYGALSARMQLFLAHFNLVIEEIKEL